MAHLWTQRCCYRNNVMMTFVWTLHVGSLPIALLHRCCWHLLSLAHAAAAGAGSPDELQSSAAVGAVELHLQLLSVSPNQHHSVGAQQQHCQVPQGLRTVAHTPLTESVVRLQQQCELHAESEAMVGFVKRAKAWWAEYLGVNPRFKHRNVKASAADQLHPAVSVWLDVVALTALAMFCIAYALYSNAE